MIKWFIDRENKVPLYLQLKDLIKYYISTGAIQDNDQLPGVVTLASELGVNFDTIRKAYKELEREELISMIRGKGTFATLHKKTSVAQKMPRISLEIDPIEAQKSMIHSLLQSGKNLKEVKKIIDKAFQDVSKESSKKAVIFTECNPLQVREISKLLKKELKLNVIASLLDDLKVELDKSLSEGKNLLGIITTGFHVNDVRDIIGDQPLDIYVLITNMSPETIRQLDAFNKKTRFGFICRDTESLPLFKDLLVAELGNDLNLSASVFADELKVKSILKSAQVLLVTPPVYDEIQESVSSKVPIFNVFERVDPMSLKVVKDRIHEKLS